MSARTSDRARLAEVAARRAGKRMDPNRAGRCYELSAEHAFGDKDAILVHGSIQGGGQPRLHHAWVIEADGRVWEPFGDDRWDAGVFARLFAAEVEASYVWDEACQHMLFSGHYGPWDEEEVT